MKKLPTMYEQFKGLADVDISKEPMEVFPTIHYTMGGIKVAAENGATTVDGLFAAGECAAGLHGANRLGGNSLSDLLVFGRRAGIGAIEYVNDSVHGTEVSDSDVQAEIARVLDPMERKPSDNDESPYLLQAELQDVMMAHANLVRDEDGLKEGLGKVLAIKDRVPNVKVGGNRMFNPGWHACQDIRYLVDVSEMIIRCAIERKEKRGSQWRLDYEELTEEYGRVNFISRRGPQGEVEIERREIPPMPDHLAELLDQAKNGVKV